VKEILLIAKERMKKEKNAFQRINWQSPKKKIPTNTFIKENVPKFINQFVIYVQVIIFD
jgi:hypothetical protein